MADTVAPGDYPVTIEGAATGLADRTATLTLTVTAAAALPDFSLTASRATLSITQGSRDSALTTVARTGGFAGVVALSVSGLPDSVTATIGAPALAGDTTTIVFTVGETAAPGSYSAIISGTGTGITARADTIALTIAQGASYALAFSPRLDQRRAGAALTGSGHAYAR